MRKRQFSLCMSSLLVMLFLVSCSKTSRRYACPPCGCAAHATGQLFESDGECPHCGMALMEKTDPSEIGNISIETGSGNFLMKGAQSHPEKTITVFYHKPENFTRRSPVLVVVPGSGRNGWDYRDAWVEASERHGILILSPYYPEKFYPEFWSYNLGGMITDVRINEERTAILDYTINKNPEKWIWPDFDRIFGSVKHKLNLEDDSYDMFGHSAGGQILHRLTLFHPDNQADRLLAANSGWYTVPVFDEPFPYGLKEGMAPENQLRQAFEAKLVIFLGEEDDEDETRGHLVRTPEVDVQGTHRLARGKHFYGQSKSTAEKMEAQFNWKIEIVPGVGHDYRRMSQKAADYLYDVDD